MPALFPSVAPGDVISSQLMNAQLPKIDALEDRVAALEGGAGGVGSLIITTFSPSFEVAAGGTLEIHGANFAFPSSLNTVSIDGVPVAAGGFLGGGSSLLIRVVVPSSISAPAGGRNVVVRVSGPSGVAERLYRILPGVPVTGSPPAISGVSPNPALIGQELVIDGANFSSTAAENHLSFVVTTGGGPVTHVVDPANILEATPARLRITVPDMAEVPPPSPFPVPVPATLELVVGSHPPASQPGGFSVQRN
jgi:hypothetical protein